MRQADLVAQGFGLDGKDVTRRSVVTRQGQRASRHQANFTLIRSGSNHCPNHSVVLASAAKAVVGREGRGRFMCDQILNSPNIDFGLEIINQIADVFLNSMDINRSAIIFSVAIYNHSGVSQMHQSPNSGTSVPRTNFFLQPSWNNGNIGAREFVANPTWQERAQLNRFRFRALVDWIDLKVTTAKPSNFPFIQRQLGILTGSSTRHYVEPHNKEAGGSATEFIFRIHDPARLSELDDLCRRFVARVPIIGDIGVQKIEVAVDAYSKANDRQELQALVLREKLGLVANGTVELESRIFTWKVENVRELRDDTTLVIKNGEIEWRIYLKETDHNKKPILDAKDHRARAEITLHGEQRPANLRKLSDLYTFRFQDLKPQLNFRRVHIDQTILQKGYPTTLPDYLNRLWTERIMGHGHRELGNPAAAERRKFHRQTSADIDLNARIRDALRELTRRFSAKKPGKSR